MCTFLLTRHFCRLSKTNYNWRVKLIFPACHLASMAGIKFIIAHLSDIMLQLPQFAPIMILLFIDLAVSCWVTINWINFQTVTNIVCSIYRRKIWITTLTSDIVYNTVQERDGFNRGRYKAKCYCYFCRTLSLSIALH